MSFARHSSAGWSNTWSYVFRDSESFSFVRRASTWASRDRILRSSSMGTRCYRPPPLKLCGAARSEDVDRFREHAPAGHVGRLRPHVPVPDVALLVLERPGPDNDEVPLADPHPFLELARDPPEAALPVRAHHADSGRPEELVRNPEDLALPPPRPR